jgi:MscS family membrane protein
MRRFFLGPVSTFVLVVIGNETILTIGAGLAAQELHRGYTIITVATVWLIWQSVNLFRDVYGYHLENEGKHSSIALLRPLISTMKIVVVMMGALVWLDNLGYQITAVLTGLGIGGIAVALVLQKPLEDVFGAITLYTQQPIRIGDFGRFGSTTGTVEEISLRTTRIRTLDNSVVAVPNMRLAAEPIENLSARRKFLYQPVLRLRNDTAPVKLHEALDKIRGMLTNHDKVLDEAMRVRFTSIGTVSHDLAVFAYIDASDWAGYLEVAEDLNFRILGILDEVGAELARPLGDVIEAGT